MGAGPRASMPARPGLKRSASFPTPGRACAGLLSWPDVLRAGAAGEAAAGLLAETRRVSTGLLATTGDFAGVEKLGTRAAGDLAGVEALGVLKAGDLAGVELLGLRATAGLAGVDVLGTLLGDCVDVLGTLLGVCVGLLAVAAGVAGSDFFEAAAVAATDRPSCARFARPSGTGALSRMVELLVTPLPSTCAFLKSSFFFKMASFNSSLRSVF